MESIGLGTYKLTPETTYSIIREALKLGYRHFDTASLYKNEEAVGRAVRDSGVERDKIWVTTKVWLKDIKQNRIGKSIKDSLERLGLDYVDLVLLHGPVEGKIVSSWQTLEEGYNDKLKGKIKHIGVSNYSIRHLEELKRVWKIKPYCNQIELTPFLRREKLVNWLRDNEIKIVAHTSLTKGALLEHSLLVELGKKYGVTSAEILLAWAISKNFVILPRTSNIEHLRSNLQVDKIKLDQKDINLLDGVPERYTSLPHYASD